MNDELDDATLRDRLGALDPMPPDSSVEPVTAPSSRTRLEKIMSTPLVDRPEPATPGHPDRSDHRDRNGRLPRYLVGVAAAAVLAVGAAVFIGTTGDDEPNSPDVAAVPLELSLGAGDSLASCMAFDVQTLASMSTAFAGTATAIDDGTVTLDVDRWYTGGEAAVVELEAAPGMAALIAGFDFEVGQTYLITAADGVVNFCGYSGPATPEFTDAFEQAFGG